MEANEILNQYGYLVKMAVNLIDQTRLPPVIDRGDLLQHGYIELLRCGGSFKDDGRAKFSTYADRCIRNHLKGVIADAHWGPKHSMQHYRKKNGKELIKDMVSYDSFLEIEEEGDQSSWIESIGEEYNLWKTETVDTQTHRVLDPAKKRELVKKIQSLLKRKEGSGICMVPRTKNSRGGFRAYAKLGKRIELGLYDSEEEAKTARKEYLTNLLEKLGPVEMHDEEDGNVNSPTEKAAMRERMRARYAVRKAENRRKSLNPGTLDIRSSQCAKR